MLIERHLLVEVVAHLVPRLTMRMRPTPELFNWSLGAQQTDLYRALRQVRGKTPIPGNGAGSSPYRASSRAAANPSITFLQGVPNAQWTLLAFRQKAALSSFARFQLLDFGKVDISFYTNKNLLLVIKSRLLMVCSNLLLVIAIWLLLEQSLT